MVKNCIKLYASGITTTDNVASIIIPQTSTLVAVSWLGWGLLTGAVGCGMQLQITPMSSSSWTSNDARGIIDEFQTGGDKATGFFYQTQKLSQLPGLKFNAGDKINLHRLVLVAPASCVVSVNLFLV